MEQLTKLLKESIRGPVRTSEPLAPYTSFKIGGPADLLIEPQDTGELVLVTSILRQKGVPFFILGNGTNILISDNGYRGAVIRPGGEFARFSYEGSVVQSGAAVLLAQLAKDACSRVFTGLEFATGIPGTLGGALFMNAGAHDRAISDVVIDAVILDRESTVHTIKAGDLGLTYRKSAITEGSIVCSARLQLEPGKKEAIEAKCREFQKFRQDRQPRLPNAGSIFKNPSGIAAGRLLEEAGLKGRKIGGAMISDAHANFIVNCGGASAGDVVSLIELAKSEVRKKFSVELDLEIKVHGD